MCVSAFFYIFSFVFHLTSLNLTLNLKYFQNKTIEHKNCMRRLTIHKNQHRKNTVHIFVWSQIEHNLYLYMTNLMSAKCFFMCVFFFFSLTFSHTLIH